MGLLDSVLGAITGQTGGAAGGGNGALLQAAIGMLANNSAGGGIAGMAQQFQQAGLGHLLDSWVGQGQNLPISADQITQVLGSGQIGQIAQQLGLSHGDAAGQLAQILPQVINQLTPNGQVPQGGLGEVGELLGKVLQQR